MDDKEIQTAVEKGVTNAFKNMGMDVSNPRLMQEDLIYLRKSREGSEIISKTMKRTAIGVAITGGMYALYEGIKHYIHIG